MGSIAPASALPPNFIVIGGGSRGSRYARAVVSSTPAKIGAVAEPDEFKRTEFGRKYIWGNETPQPHQQFSSWEEWISFESHRRQQPNADTDPNRITGVFICTLDETHATVIYSLAPLNLHILCEKPLALSLSDCLSIHSTLSQYPPRIYSIGHVLRYSPHNILLRKLLCDEQVIGEIVSIEHTEPIGWWHFSHSYVRGNWRRETADAGSLLTKSCHDIDFIMWLLCSPSKLTGKKPHLPSTITSSGNLTHFRRAKKPNKAGGATNCLDCAVESDCMYSAKRLYRDLCMRQEKDTGWPLKIVAPEIEDTVANHGWEKAEEKLMEKLAENYDKSTSDEEIGARSWYGRCVYESDNNVCDDQTVTVCWDEDMSAGDQAYGRGPKQALFHMTYPTLSRCDRRGTIYGSEGEMTYDSKTITVHTFADGVTRTHTLPKQAEEVEKSHGGGDWGLTGAYVNAIMAADGGEMSVEEAQWKYVGCDLEEVVRSHEIVFAAERARKGKIVVNYAE